MSAAALPLNFIGALKAGQAQASSANYQAQVDRNNAIIANQNAGYATEAGAQHAMQQGLQNRALQGRIVAGQAANGIDPNTGSALAVQDTARQTGLTDVQQTQNNAALQAYGYRTQATNYNAQAQLSSMQASQATQGAQLGAFGSLASGVGQLGSQWNALQQSGFGSGGAS